MEIHWRVAGHVGKWDTLLETTWRYTGELQGTLGSGTHCWRQRGDTLESCRARWEVGHTAGDNVEIHWRVAGHVGKWDTLLETTWRYTGELQGTLGSGTHCWRQPRDTLESCRARWEVGHTAGDNVEIHWRVAGHVGKWDTLLETTWRYTGELQGTLGSGTHCWRQRRDTLESCRARWEVGHTAGDNVEIHWRVAGHVGKWDTLLETT